MSSIIYARTDVHNTDLFIREDVVRWGKVGSFFPPHYACSALSSLCFCSKPSRAATVRARRVTELVALEAEMSEGISTPGQVAFIELCAAWTCLHGKRKFNKPGQR